MAEKLLKAELILESRQALRTISQFVKDVEKGVAGINIDGNLSNKAQAAGRNAGAKLASGLIGAANAALAGFTLGGLVNQIGTAVAAQRSIIQANTQLAGAARVANNEVARSNAVLGNSKSTYEQKAVALGISTDKLYKEVSASGAARQANAGLRLSNNQLEQSIKQRTRTFEDSLKPLEAALRIRDNESDQIQNQINIVDRQISNTQRSIQAINKESSALDKQTALVKRNTEAKIQALRNSLGAGDLEKEKTALQIQKNKLEVKRDEARIGGDFVAARFIQLEIDKLDTSISLNQNKLQLIDFQTDGLKEQEKAQLAGIEVQKEALNLKKDEVEAQQQSLEVQKQGLQDQIQNIRSEVQRVRDEIENRKAKFDIDIEPAKRKLEDLNEVAQNQSLSSSAAGGGTTRALNPKVTSFLDKQKALPVPQFNDKDITARSKQLLEGLGKQLGNDAKGNPIDIAKYITDSNLKKALGDIFRSGITDVKQAEDLLKRFVESAASGKSPTIDMGTAVENLAFAFRTNNSQLGNLSGIQENYEDIVKDGTDALIEQAIATGDLETAERLRSGVLTSQEEAQAKLLGTQKATNDTIGGFGEIVKTGALEGDAFNNSIKILQASLGEGLLPAVNGILDAVNPMIQGFAQFAKDNPAVVQAAFALVGALAGAALILGVVGGVVGTVTGLMTAFGVTTLAAFIPMIAPFAAVAAAIAALGVLVAGFYIAWQSNFLGIRETTEKNFKAVQEFYEKYVKPTFEILVRLVQNKFEEVKSYVSGLINFWGQKLNEAAEFFLSLRDKAISYFVSLSAKLLEIVLKINWGEMWKGLTDGLSNAIKSAAEFISKINWGNLLRGAANGIMDFFRGIIRGFGAGIPGSEAVINPIINAIPRFASGGLVDGKNILAMLNDGGGPEFVINAEATKRFLPLLEAINAGRFNSNNRRENVSNSSVVNNNQSQTNNNFTSGFNSFLLSQQYSTAL